MNSTFKILAISILFSSIVCSCNNGPKKITPSENNEHTEKNATEISKENSTQPSTNQSFADDLHTVVVNEILPTERYVYLHVKEGEKEFWVATRKQDIQKGKTYYYKGGLLKTNFESKEYNRVFKTVYLVSNLVAQNHADNTGNLKKSMSKMKPIATSKVVIPTHTEKPIVHKGSVKIAEVVKNPKKYEGKTIQISGRCVKINPGIMGRNWIHLKDGSKDDFDMVVTSNVFVKEGDVVTMKAKVALNKDFGAGYKYDLILEEGVLIK